MDHLIDRLGAQDAVERVRAAQSLAKIGVSTIPALTAALENDDPHIRGSAVWALQLIGPPAATAFSKLEELAEDDPDSEVRRVAISALIAVSELPEREALFKKYYPGQWVDLKKHLAEILDNVVEEFLRDNQSGGDSERFSERFSELFRKHSQGKMQRPK